MRKVMLSLAVGAACIYGGSAFAVTPSVTEVEKLVASDAAQLDRFGEAVAIDGNTALVGAWADDDQGDDSGAVYVFTKDAAGVWTEQQKILASDGGPDHRFGHDVVIEGDTAVIGRNSWTFEGTQVGTAYVFTRDGSGVWTESQKLTAYDQAPGDEFGEHVALSGNTLLVSAAWDDDGGSGTGSVYVFTNDGTGGWSFQQKLHASNASDYDMFGSAVAIDGDTAVISADGYDASPELSFAGMVYVFTRDGSGVWSEVQSFTAPQASLGDGPFGQVVAVNNETMLVGNDFDDEAGINAGAVYLYTRDGSGVWSLQQKLLASDGVEGDYFGQSIDVEGDNLAIGAYGDDDNGLQAGSVYIFARDASGTWSERLKLLTSDAVEYDYLGMGTASVRLSGETVLAGAETGDSSIGVSTGSAYLFDIAQSSGQNVSISTAAVNFGDILVGDSEQRLVTVSNIGDSALSITSIAIASGTDYSQVNDCPATLLPAEACQITVTFSPTAGGALLDTLTVMTSDPDEPAATVALSGTGLTELPDLLVSAINSPNPLPANGYATISITIENQGTADVNGGYYVHLYLDNTEIGMDWISYAPAAGASQEVDWFVAVPNYQGNHTLRATVDTLDHIQELNEANNELSQSVFVQR